YFRTLRLFAFHRIDVFRPGKRSSTYFGRVVGNRLFDPRAKRAIALDELWNARRKPEHVLEHQNLSIAGNTGSDTDGRDRHRSRKLSRERFRDCFNHNRKRARLRNRDCVLLDPRPVGFIAPLRPARTDRVDPLRSQSDVSHNGDAALGEETDRLGHALSAFDLDRATTRLTPHAS